MANIPILYPLQNQKIKYFLVFSGAMQWEHCLINGLIKIFQGKVIHTFRNYFKPLQEKT